MGKLVTKEAIEDAAALLAPVVNHTPLQFDHYLSEKYDCHVYLKREDLQRVRSFKIRGAYYAISQLSATQLAAGVVCASAGNHAQGVAYTCHQLKVKATIFMPTTTPHQKVDQVRFFGRDWVTIELIGDTFDESARASKEFALAQQQAFIDPFDDLDTITGQGSLAVEVMADLAVEKLDYVFSAIGGGGLISGVSAYLNEVSPETKLIGVEPKGATSMAAALTAGQVVELATVDKFVDGAAVKAVGQHTLAHVQAYVDKVIAVDEGLVCSTILELYTREAIVVEPAGALSVAALADYQAEIRGKTVVCIVSGGNNDITRTPEIEERSLIYEGLKHYFLINFPQRPGALREFVTDILGPNDDITKFEYTKKVNRGSGPVVIGILLADKKDTKGLKERLRLYDPGYIDLNDNQMLFTLLV